MTRMSGGILKHLNTHPHRSLHTKAHPPRHSSQSADLTGPADEQIHCRFVTPLAGTLVSHKKKQSSGACYNVAESRKHCAK